MLEQLIAECKKEMTTLESQTRDLKIKILMSEIILKQL